MATIQQRIRKEPAIITGLATALIALGLAFGLNLTEEQIGAIMGVVVIVAALITRTQVTPVEPTPKPRDPNKRAGPDPH